MTEAASYDAEHYVQRLDLGEDPFAVDFESDYFYTGGMRRQLLDQLVHFSRFGDQTVLLVGATGSGTSTLLDQACELIEESLDCCYINAEEFNSPEQVLESLNEQLNFQLPSPINQAEFFAALRSGLVIDGEPEPIMLAVDQAHYLSLEAYTLLREVVELGDGNIGLLIAGEYQVEQMAKLAAFNDGQIKLVELEPLTAAETGDYILGLLRSVGYAGEIPLSNDQLAVLYERSGGNFVEINQLVPSLLSVKEAANTSTFRFGIPVAHAAAIGILAGALILSWLYLGSDKPPVEEALSQEVATEEPATIEELKPPSIALVKEEPVSQPKVPAELAPETAEVSSGAIERSVATEPEPEPVPEKAQPAAVPAVASEKVAKAESEQGVAMAAVESQPDDLKLGCGRRPANCQILWLNS